MILEGWVRRGKHKLKYTGRKLSDEKKASILTYHTYCLERAKYLDGKIKNPTDNTETATKLNESDVGDLTETETLLIQKLNQMVNGDHAMQVTV